MARCPSSVCLSVCKLFCANHFYYETNGWIVTKLAHDSLQVSAHPGCAQGRGQRSRDTGTLWCHENRFFSRAMFGLRPNLHTMISMGAFSCAGTWWAMNALPTRRQQAQVELNLSQVSVLWVRSVSSAIAHNSHTGSETVCQQFVKLFAIQYSLTFCLHMHSLYEASLGPTLSFQTKYQGARSNV